MLAAPIGSSSHSENISSVLTLRLCSTIALTCSDGMTHGDLSCNFFVQSRYRSGRKSSRVDMIWASLK
ncbi:unnamed protein product [Chondrus crispus]|uniref:Uncharacterized protein n=1 Tax=Chondrus crispus TaxID=2769 RepID=R7QR07_CHOCR|nr:unnamed protein product [Chondrus crispus]CDF40193.1 unnamed protein product [Chondrus crispus]|eukprot:XP_005710487.1 unnamed protein product [Chondrus crispus]